MKTENSPNPGPRNFSIKIIGVGSAGVGVLRQLHQPATPGWAALALNTDPVTDMECLPLDAKQLRNVDGIDPAQTEAALAAVLPGLKEWCAGADVVFIVAGLGGKTGSAASHFAARVAKEAGALVLGFVAMPFEFEGGRRLRQAREGLEKLKAAADGVVCLPNQKIFKLVDDNTSVLDAFRMAGDLLAGAVQGARRLLAAGGLIDIHFEELCELLRGSHAESLFATAEASGPDRAGEVVEKLLAHPLLDGGRAMAGARTILVSLVGGPGLSLAEVNRVMEYIGGQCESAQILMGAAIDETFAGRLAVTVIAARREEAKPTAEAELHRQLLNPEETERPASRFVAPPPEMSPEKMAELAGRRPARSRKNASRMKQQQLPLEIISKGRFDKSEPTVRNGEDLDVPTYIRRGLVLN
jgi:cell division protein FtsZ